MGNDVVSINELKVNPFCFRLCKAFAQDNAAYLMFEEFLDLMSVMSEAAPAQVKAEWAFRVFDFDGDNRLSKEDTHQVVDAITNSGEMAGVESNTRLDNEEIKNIVKNVMDETDLNRTGLFHWQNLSRLLLNLLIL